MASFRTPLLVTAATALSLGATPAALANLTNWNTYTTNNTAGGLGGNTVNGVYATDTGTSIFAESSCQREPVRCRVQDGPAAWGRAGEIYRSHSIDWDAIASWAENEKPEFNGVERLRAEADSQA